MSLHGPSKASAQRLRLVAASISSTLTRTRSACQRTFPTRRVATPSSRAICGRPFRVPVPQRGQARGHLQVRIRDSWVTMSSVSPVPKDSSPGSPSSVTRGSTATDLRASRGRSCRRLQGIRRRQGDEDRRGNPGPPAQPARPAAAGAGPGRRRGRDTERGVPSAAASSISDSSVGDVAQSPRRILSRHRFSSRRRERASPRAAPPTPPRAPGSPRECPGPSRPGAPKAGQGFVETATERPDVRALVHRLAPGLLRAHVRRGPEDSPLARVTVGESGRDVVGSRSRARPGPAPSPGRSRGASPGPRE